MKEALAVEDLTLRVGARTLVDWVAFDVRPGEVVAVIGPNGAGKTTLLEGIVGLRRRAGGAVRLGSRPLQSFAEHAAAFAFAADDALPPSEAEVKTIVDHARLHRPRSSEVLQALQHDLGLEAFLDRPAGLLSRGERKRVALYVALAAERPVVALDEPFGAFDPLQLRDVLAAVRRLAVGGAAIVVTIHQLSQAERIADRVLLLADGKCAAFGPIPAIRGRAKNAASLEDAFVTILSDKGGAGAS